MILIVKLRSLADYKPFSTTPIFWLMLILVAAQVIEPESACDLYTALLQTLSCYLNSFFSIGIRDSDFYLGTVYLIIHC